MRTSTGSSSALPTANSVVRPAGLSSTSKYGRRSVAAGAVVTADVPDYAIMGGVPAKLIRYRFPENVVQQLLEIQWWNWSEERLREAQPQLAQPDVNSFLEWARRS